MTNWNIIRREDSNDEVKHMGLILLAPKGSNIMNFLTSLRYQKALRNNKLQVEGLIVRLTNEVNIGFLYCRSTPNEAEIKGINKHFTECNV